MNADLPNHQPGLWQLTPWWLFWKPPFRRRNGWWKISDMGCCWNECWDYQHEPRSALNTKSWRREKC